MDWDWTILSCEIEDLPILTGAKSRKHSRYFDIDSSQDLDEVCSSEYSSQSSSQESNGACACSSSLSSKWNGDSVNLIALPLENLQLYSKTSESGAIKKLTGLEQDYGNQFPCEFQDYNPHNNNNSSSIVKKYYDVINNDHQYASFKNGFGHIQETTTATSSSTTTIDNKNQEKKKKMIPKFFMSPRSPDPFMGGEVIYFVHGEVGIPLPPLESFYVAIIHPDPGSPVQFRKLRRDTSKLALNRYLFSFVPRFPGEHIIVLKFLLPCGEKNVEIVEAGGGPQKVLVSRNYPLVKRESFNHIRIGFELEQSEKLLSKGWGVAIYHQMNHIYLADRDSDQIVVLDSTGKVINKFGEFGHNPGQFWRPTGICIDEVNGRVIVTDKDHHRISIFSLNGDYILSFGSGGHQDGQFNYPWGVDVSKDGELIAVADSRNHRVQIFDKNGTFLRKFSVFEVRPFDFKEEFYYPRGICFDNTDENLYVTDFNIHAVFKLDVGLTSKTTIIRDGHFLHRPQGITMDPAGNLLVCDTNSNCIQIYKSSGDFICSLEGSGRDLFVSPMDVSVFKDGKIAVVDEYGRFRVF